MQAVPSFRVLLGLIRVDKDENFTRIKIMLSCTTGGKHCENVVRKL